MENKDQISTLNSLIETTVDSVTGYEDSAKNVDNERFREIFRSRADERQKVVEELRSEVRRLGGDPEDSGSFMGKAHQRFEDLRPRSRAATKSRSSMRSNAAKTTSRASSKPRSRATILALNHAKWCSAASSRSAKVTTR